MQEKNIARGLLQESELNVADAARLVLEAQEALGRLVEGKKRGEVLQLLRRVIWAGIQRVQQEEMTVTLEQAAWARVKAAEDKLRPVSLRDLRYYVRRMLRVEKVSQLPLRGMTVRDCRHILTEAFAGSTCAWRKARAILHSIFAYGMRQEWCDSNPVTRIETPRHQEATIEPLTLQEVQRLRQAARGSDMELSLHLMLFGGIRPAEVARLSAEDISWSEEVVIIRATTSKTGGGRMVPLRGCSRIRVSQRIIPRGWQRRWRDLRQKAGFVHWVPDVCRHTFASYYAAHFRNLPALQLEMGHHDLNLLRSRYMRPASAKIASKFWAIARE